MKTQNTAQLEKVDALRSPKMKKIALFESFDVESKHLLQEKLLSQSLSTIITVANTDNLLAEVQKIQPDILVLSIDSLSPSALDQLIKINAENPVPVAVFARQSSEEMLKTAICAGVDSYVVDDVQEHRLSTILDLAVARFEQFNNLAKELEQTKEKLSERKLIARAKGILMQQKNLSEDLSLIHI